MGWNGEGIGSEPPALDRVLACLVRTLDFYGLCFVRFWMEDTLGFDLPFATICPSRRFVLTLLECWESGFLILGNV